VEVRLGGDAGADVQELPYAVARQPAGGAVHEGPVDPRHLRDARVEGEHLPARGLVDRVVVLAAGIPVLHPRGMRLGGVDLDESVPPGHDALHRILQQ
jgi:hypothetical protein